MFKIGIIIKTGWREIAQPIIAWKANKIPNRESPRIIISHAVLRYPPRNRIIPSVLKERDGVGTNTEVIDGGYDI